MEDTIQTNKNDNTVITTVSKVSKNTLKSRRRMKRIKADPERYRIYLEKQKQRYQKRKVDDHPIQKERNRIKSSLYYHNNVKLDNDKLNRIKEKSQLRYQKIKNTPELYNKLKEKYKESWRRSGYNRMRIQVFRRLARHSNRWYKINLISAFDLWKIAKRQKLICPFTGQKLTIDNMSVDHIIPKSKGGLNIPSNIRLVIKSINIARQSMTDVEFIEMCKLVVIHCNKYQF